MNHWYVVDIISFIFGGEYNWQLFLWLFSFMTIDINFAKNHLNFYNPSLLFTFCGEFHRQNFLGNLHL